MSLSIVLADDHQMVREGLRSLLEYVADFRVVGEAGDGRAVAPLVARLEPDVLVLDLMMPGLNGLDVARLVCSHAPHPAVVVLSMHSNEAYVLETLRRCPGLVSSRTPAATVWYRPSAPSPREAVTSALR